MADYDTTVSVELYDDFEKLKRGLDEILPKLRQIQSQMGSISKININSSGLTRMVKQLNNLASVQNLDKSIANLNKTLGSINFTNIKSLREELAKMKQEYNNFISMMNRQTGDKIKKTNISTSVRNRQFDSTGLNDLKGTRNQNITSYISQMNEGLNSVDRTAQKTKKSINSMFSIGKIYWFANYTKQMFRGLGNIITKALDFTEVENYFSRAMGNMYDKAMTFQNKLSDMYGMAQGTMMQAQATYKNMIGSLGGLSDEMAYKLSETVTKMTLDFSSLYNVDFEKTTQKFQSALSKQVRPIRSVSGYDITQSVLGATASNLGIDRSIAQMNELEKRLLVILTLMQQMRNSGAMNDFARTIEQPSNQLRILQEQLQEVGRWIGSVFYGIIGNILPYINGFVMAIKELVKTFALFVGFEIPNSSGETGTILDSYGDSMEELNNGITDAGKNTDKATKKAKEWKNVLMSFDVANVMPDQSSSDSGSSGGTSGAGGMSIDPKILDALNKYKYLFDDIHMKAQDIRDELLKWASIAKKSFKENIFEPIKKSWDKYGSSIYGNFKNSFESMRKIASGVFDVVAEKWRPFFQSGTDLFFSLLDTASLVSSSISKFLENVWNSGGKYFLEGIFDLSTAFIKLATAINDKFVKPTVNLFKNTLGVAFSTVLGGVLGLIGKFMTALSKFITWVSKSDSAVRFLGISLTTVFAVATLGKINNMWNSFAKGTSTLSKLITLFAENTKVGKKLFDLYVGGVGKFDRLRSAWQSGLSVISNLITSFAKKVNALTLDKTALEGSTIATKGLTTAQTFCTTASQVLTGALTFLGNHPLVAVALAVGTVVTGLALLDSQAGDTTKKIEDCSQEIQDQAQEVRDFKDAVDSAVKSSKDQIASTEAQVNVTEKYIDKLKAMQDEDGYVKNIEQAKFFIEEINKVLPDTFEITEDGRVIQKQSNEELEKSIDLTRKQAEVRAYQEVYVESLKNQIQAEQKVNEQKEKLIELYVKAKDSYNEYIKSIENGTTKVDGHVLSYDEWIDALERGDTELSEQKALVEDTEKNLSSITETTEKYGDKLDILSDSLGETSKKTSKLSDATKKAFDNIGKNGQKNINSIIDNLKEYDKKIADTSGKTDEVSKKELETTRKLRDNKVLEYAKMVRDYDVSYEQIIEYARSNGIEFSLSEQGTIAGIVEIYKNGGVNAGDNYVNRLSSQIANGSWRISDSAKGNVLNTNEILKNVPIEYRTAVEEALSKAKLKRQEAQNGVGKINVGVNVDGNGYAMGKEYARSFKNGLSSISATIGGAMNGVMEAFGKIKFFADGGFPDVGQMFIAREKGPELVGRMGSKNTVANNAQIENGIYKAVLSAVRDAGGMVQRGQGGDLHIVIQDEDGRTKIEKIIKNYNDYIRSTGGEGGFVL